MHAFAVSHNTLLLSGYATHNKGKVSLAANLFFNQLLLFGPLSIIAAMLAQPCPLLIAPEFVAIYGGVHLFNILSGMGPALVHLSGMAGAGLLLDLVYLTADAFARSDGMAALGVEVVRAHPNALIATSPWANLLVGWAVGVGSILMLGMITFEDVNWTLRTPVWLTSPSMLLGADFISSFLATLAYYVSTSPQGLAALRRPVASVINSRIMASASPRLLPLMPYLAAVTTSTMGQLRIQQRTKMTSSNLADKALLSSPEARAVGALIVLTFSLGRRFKNMALESMAKSTGSKSGITATQTTRAKTSHPATPVKSPNAQAKTNGTPRKRK